MIVDYQKPPKEIPIQDFREFAAKYGHDVAVLVVWSHETGTYQTVTAGINKHYADSSVMLRDLVEGVLDVELKDLKDKRGEHPTLSSSTFRAALALFRHSFSEIEFRYEGLTEAEKARITPAQFTELVAEVRSIEARQQIGA